MKRKKDTESFEKHLWEDVVIFKRKTYRRTEIKSGGEQHIITWKHEKKDESDVVEYYTASHGWSKDGMLHKDNTTPEIEIEFQKEFRNN